MGASRSTIIVSTTLTLAQYDRFVKATGIGREDPVTRHIYTRGEAIRRSILDTCKRAEIISQVTTGRKP